MKLKTRKLWYRSATEEAAVLWFKKSYPHQWRKRALEEWSTEPEWFKRAHRRFRHTEHRPFGNAEMNRMFRAARHCIRINRYFPEIARKGARRTFLPKGAKPYEINIMARQEWNERERQLNQEAAKRALDRVTPFYKRQSSRAWDGMIAATNANDRAAFARHKAEMRAADEHFNRLCSTILQKHALMAA